MSKGFENLFEKYNITCEIPRKRRKINKTLKQTNLFCNNGLKVNNVSIVQENEAESSQQLQSDRSNGNLLKNDSAYFFNKTSKGKYYNPTRYKTLDVMGVTNNNVNCSFMRSSLLDDANMSISNINCDENLSNIGETASEGFSTNVIDCHNHSPTKTSKCRTPFQQHNILPSERVKNVNVFLVKEDKQNNDSQNFHTESPMLGNTESVINQSLKNTSTELDLLIELIEQQENNSRNTKENKQIDKSLNCDKLPPSKSQLKGGYEELFERALKQEKVKSNFLKHDKKIGLRTGQLLTVVDMETSYGLTLATVKSKDLSKNFAIAIRQEMYPRLKLGDRIEVFFDDTTCPYKLQVNEEDLDIYLEPYKILME